MGKLLLELACKVVYNHLHLRITEGQEGVQGRGWVLGRNEFILFKTET